MCKILGSFAITNFKKMQITIDWACCVMNATETFTDVSQINFKCC